MDNKKLTPVYLYILVLACLFLYSKSAFCFQNASGEFLAFPYLEALYNADVDSDSGLPDDEYSYGIDLFTTYEIGRFRFLGEVLVAKHEQHVERLQLSWAIGEYNRIWVGRFHNPVGFWNTQYHHGDFLEASIRRPAITEFEDEGGVIPMHLGGILYEGRYATGDSGIGYKLAVAAGPEFDGKLEAWDPLRPVSNEQDISTTVNLYYEPFLFGDTRYGVFANYTVMPAEDSGLDEIDLFMTGMYANWASGPWHIIGSFFYLRNDFNGLARDGSFANFYVQSEYMVNDNWTLYGRVETTISEDNDTYLALSPDFIEDRLLAGLRLDFAQHHALKLEISGNHTSTDEFYRINLQWSAVF